MLTPRKNRESVSLKGVESLRPDLLHVPKTRSGQPCTSDDVLETRENLHTAIPLVRRSRKLGHRASDPAILVEIRGYDGRVHAEQGRTRHGDRT